MIERVKIDCNKLRGKMTERGVTQKDLSIACGMEKSYISTILLGKKPIYFVTRPVFKLMCVELGCKAGELEWCGEPVEQKQPIAQTSVDYMPNLVDITELLKIIHTDLKIIHDDGLKTQGLLIELQQTMHKAGVQNTSSMAKLLNALER